MREEESRRAGPPYTHTFSFGWAQPRGWWDVRRRFRAWRRRRSVHDWRPVTSTGSLTLTFTDPDAPGTWGPTLVSGGPAPEGHIVGGLCHCGLFHPSAAYQERRPGAPGLQEPDGGRRGD